MISVSIFLMIKFMSYTEISKKIEKSKYGDSIVLLSQYSYGIYLSHYLVLFNLKRFIMNYIDYASQNSIIWIPLLVIITLISSFIILWILNKIPYLKKVTGAN